MLHWIGCWRLDCSDSIRQNTAGEIRCARLQVGLGESKPAYFPQAVLISSVGGAGGRSQLRINYTKCKNDAS